jgi:anthranilate synthase/indole-3-glycerol phosphate synthase/phosphoribosylanthranilate isomerase
MRSSDVRSAIRGLCLDPIDYYNNTHNNGGSSSSSSIAVVGEGGVAASAVAAAGGAYIGGMKVIKICGIATPHDALVACRAGANLIGIIFAEKSKRRVSITMATEIVSAVREFGERSNRITIALLDDNNDDGNGNGNGEKAGFGGGGESSTLGHASVISTLVVRARTLEQITSRRPIVVGVFQNQSIDYIKNIVNECGLDMIQLHGNEGMEAANSKNYGVPAIRVVDIELGGGGGDECDDEKKLSSAEIASTILGKVTMDPYAILLDTTGGGTGLTFDWTIAEAIQNMGLPVIVAGGLTPDNIGMVVGGARPWGVDVAGGVEAGPGMKDCDKVRKFVDEARSAAVEADKGF